MTQNTLDLKDCTLSDLGQLDYGYARGSLPLSTHPLLVVRLAGVLTNESNEIFDLAAAIIMAGMEAWQPWALILDLRGLDYSWGDWMQNVLAAAQHWHEPVQPVRNAFGGGLVPKQFPLAVVVSDLNREGLTSLVREQMHREPHDLLYESLEDAVRALDERLVGVPVM